MPAALKLGKLHGVTAEHLGSPAQVAEGLAAELFGQPARCELREEHAADGRMTIVAEVYHSRVQGNAPLATRTHRRHASATVEPELPVMGVHGLAINFDRKPRAQAAALADLVALLKRELAAPATPPEGTAS